MHFKMQLNAFFKCILKMHVKMHFKNAFPILRVPKGSIWKIMIYTLKKKNTKRQEKSTI